MLKIERTLQRSHEVTAQQFLDEIFSLSLAFDVRRPLLAGRCRPQTCHFPHHALEIGHLAFQLLVCVFLLLLLHGSLFLLFRLGLFLLDGLLGGSCLCFWLVVIDSGDVGPLGGFHEFEQVEDVAVLVVVSQ